MSVSLSPGLVFTLTEEPPKTKLAHPRTIIAGSVWTRQLKNAFTESLVVLNPQTADSDPTFTPPQNTGPCEDFTPVFLRSHDSPTFPFSLIS
ncbi:hypothetical protein N7536_007332 [Penicillium majusculum]|nr:hypothetical protein N7536_007332 [Penicillium majusculum]